MSEYEMIMFLQNHKISVMEVDVNSNSKVIGFHGEDYFQYENTVDITDFYKNLTDTYNINDLSELDANVFLIDCGIDSETKWNLIEKLKSCECINFINISSLLPILLSKKGLLQVGKQIVVEFLDEKYAYICDDEYHVEELAIRGKKAQHLIKLEDFSFIVVWNGNLSAGNNDSNEKLEEAKQAWEQEKIQLEKELKETGALCREWEDKYNQLQLEVQEQIKERNESISQEMVSRRRLVEVEFLSHISIIKEKVKTGETVIVNQKIGAMTRRRNEGFEAVGIFSPRAGKIAWIPLDGDDLYPAGKNRIVLVSKIVGVVGDEDDNEDEMIKWATGKIEEKRRNKPIQSL